MIPDSKKSANEKCYWSSKDKKCGSFKDSGYNSTCTDSFIDDLATYGDSMEYAGMNVQSLDGKKAYITDSGVMKMYPDASSFTATAGLHGCPKPVTQLNKMWDKLGFPAGSAMTKGQSCGNETAYVTAAPPENNFDPLWYRKTYPELKLTTDDEAINDWKTAGQAAGRLPNPNILKSMAALGTVGYIDPNSVMHGISEHTYFGMKSFTQRSNVTGKRMADCTAMAYVKYSSSVVLAADDNNGYLTTDNVLKFGKEQRHVLIVRPPPNSNTNATTVVKYGDKISLANSTQNMTTNFGYYGCKVGMIDNNTWNYVFAPGGNDGGSMLQLMPTTEAYVVGQSISYGTPFYITATQPVPNNSLYQSKIMLPGESLPSVDDRYYLTFRADGYVVLYKSPSTEKWKSETGSSKAKRLRISATGNLQAEDTDGVPYWTSKGKPGRAPFALAIQTDGTLVMYDADMKVVWNIGESDKTLQNLNQTLYASVDSDNQLTFSDNVSDQSVFSFQNSDPSKAEKQEECDVTQMQMQCGSGCAGFIHDGVSNEWQKIMVGSKETDFKITPTTPDVYMKIPYVALADKSCEADLASFIDQRTFSSYVMGTPFTSKGSKQCGPTDKALDAKQKLYLSKNEAQWKEAIAAAKAYDNSPLKGLQQGALQKLQANEGKMNEVQKFMKKMEDDPNNDTYKKQAADSGILHKQARAQAVFWVLVALAAAVFIAVARYGGIVAALTLAALGGVLYLGYRVFR
jgi:hypothetical protein